MPDSCTPSAPALRFEIRPSRRLRVWWLALHVLIAAAAFMVSPWAGLAVLPPLVLHGLRVRPLGGARLMSASRGRFALPTEGRHDLILTAASRAGPGWVLLIFDDRPDRPLLLLSDQLDPQAWRRLRLALSERR